MAKKKKSSVATKERPRTPLDKRREVADDDSIPVGSGNMDREPLPDDVYLNGVIRRLEIRENVPNAFGGDPFDKLQFGVECLDHEDEHSEDNGNRMAFCGCKVSMHPKANLYKYVKAILGVDPKDGMEFRPLSLLNVPCRVLMKTWENEDGSPGQAISDFKPWKGKLKKGMRDPAEVAEELTATLNGKGKKGKKKGKKAQVEDTEEETEGDTDEMISTISSYLQEGGTDLVTLIAEECGFTKKDIRAALKGEGEDPLILNTLHLLATNKYSEKFEGLAKALTPWFEAAQADPDDFSEWGTIAAYTFGHAGHGEWPKTLKELKSILKEGPGEESEEEEEEEEEEERDYEYMKGDRLIVDYEGDELEATVTGSGNSSVEVKYDVDDEVETVKASRIVAFIEEDSDEEEEEEDDDDDDDDSDLSFLDE